MLTDHGRRHAAAAVDKLLADLTAHGGPYAGLLTPDPDNREITEPGSGLLRKPVTGGIGPDMHARWEAFALDDGTRVQWIGLATTPEGPFLFQLPVAKPTPSNPEGIVELALGDTVQLTGPLRVTVS